MSRPCAWLALLAWAGLLACGRPAPPSVVLVSVDTLRADAVGAYGGPLPTPTLDRMAAEGALFERVFAPTPTTAPSHATLLTGQEVRRHGLLRNGESLGDGAATLAELFRSRGYATAGFVSSFVLDARFGWDRGFDLFDAALPRDGATMKREPYPGAFWARHRFEGFDRRAAATTDAAVGWLAQAPKPFFLFVHYFDPHAPYVAPEVFRSRVSDLRPDLRDRDVRGVAPPQLERLIRRYHAEVLYTDDALGALLDAVERATGDDALVVVTADHGEGLGQHGWLEHAVHLYDEQIAVPLILRWPGHVAAGRRVATPVGLVDVAPTILALAGFEPPADMDGRSLAEAARGGAEPGSRPIFGLRVLVNDATQWDRGVEISVRTDRWKYIFDTAAPHELYDLAADPGELRDVLAEHPETATSMRGLLEAHIAALPARDEVDDLSEDTRRALRALGYIQ